MKMNKTRQELADMFINSLQEGKLPWRACWKITVPENAVTHARYRGINQLLLSYVAETRGYGDPRWCTYLQAQKRGWQVQRGAKGVPVEYWALYDPEAKKLLNWKEAAQIRRDDPDRYETLQLRYRISTVFNAEQIDGIPELQKAPPLIAEEQIVAARDRLLQNMQLDYREDGQEAYYNLKIDRVTLPPMERFDDGYAYFATLLHECGHASGHPDRLDRPFFGGDKSDYAREELRAEIASSYTAQALGVELPDELLTEHLDLHKAYIQNWLAVLKDNPDELFAAIKDADKISDYLLEKGEFTPERGNAPAPELTVETAPCNSPAAVTPISQEYEMEF